MTDVIDAAKRSEVMSKIRSRRNGSTELVMARLLRTGRLSGWRRHVELRPRPTESDMAAAVLRKNGRIRVRPDFVFRGLRLAIFVDGCFWHACPMHSSRPKQNAQCWGAKLRANCLRDRVATNALQAAGWRVERIWEHELHDAPLIVARSRAALGQ